MEIEFAPIDAWEVKLEIMTDQQIDKWTDRRTDSVVEKFHFQQRKILGFTLAFISSSQNIICIFTYVRVDVFRNRQVYGFIIITE